jgi:hypothetical protein
MAEFWIAHAALSDCLSEIAVIGTGHETDLHRARADYVEAMRAIIAFASTVASMQAKALREQPPEWQRSPDAEIARFWVNGYRDLAQTFATLVAGSGPGAPDESLLTAFEELPDCP